jgi:hypothetical protein
VNRKSPAKRASQRVGLDVLAPPEMDEVDFWLTCSNPHRSNLFPEQERDVGIEPYVNTSDPDFQTISGA